MAFSEALKAKVRQRADFNCCLCHAVGVEVHHIIPEAEGGPDNEDNAAPLCPTCHDIYGANPEKRKFIREARDCWYEVCERRYQAVHKLETVLEALQNLASKKDLHGLKAEMLAAISVVSNSDNKRGMSLGEVLNFVYGKNFLSGKKKTCVSYTTDFCANRYSMMRDLKK